MSGGRRPPSNCGYSKRKRRKSRDGRRHSGFRRSRKPCWRGSGRNHRLTMLPVQKKAGGWTRNRKSPGPRSRELTPRSIEGKMRPEDLCKTITRLTKADTRRISTAPPPTVTNPSITTDLSPLTPQSPLDLLQATPTDKRFVLRGGVNITALRLYLLTGYPPQECPQTDPRMPQGPMGPRRGL